jgi:tetrapyrrole methylase family protein/MazG family protein
MNPTRTPPHYGPAPASPVQLGEVHHTPVDALLFLVEIVHRLRAPDGCPWDRAQTHQSLRQYLIEEAFEVLDVLDRIDTPEALNDPKNRADFREELGDLLMQVVLHTEMTAQAGAFNLFDVAQTLAEKLIRRHPHVFGEAKAGSADAALKSWEMQKAKEKAQNPEASVLDGVPKGLPALQKSARIIEKVTKVGFQWKDLEGPVDKLHEELREFEAEARALEKVSKDDPSRAGLKKRAEDELGDLLFSISNVAYLLKLNPEDALRSTLARFHSRFRHIERRLKEQGKGPEESTLEEMDSYWNEAKILEKGKG